MPTHIHVQCALAPPKLHVLQADQEEEKYKGKHGALQGQARGGAAQGERHAVNSPDTLLEQLRLPAAKLSADHQPVAGLLQRSTGLHTPAQPQPSKA
jgi:hypothetical protein